MSDEMFAAWADQLADVEIPEVEDLTKLSDAELTVKIVEIDEELAELKELHFPHSDRGRELHSLRAAITVETHNPKRLRR